MKTLGWLGSGAAVTAIVSSADVNVFVIITISVATVLAIAIATLGRDWFWICALRRPGRDLRMIMKRTRSAKDAETLAMLLESSHAVTVAARAACQRFAPVTRTSSCSAPCTRRVEADFGTADHRQLRLRCGPVLR